MPLDSALYRMLLNDYLCFCTGAQPVGATAAATATVDAVEAEPTAGPYGLCGNRRAAQPSVGPSFMDAGEEVCKNHF